MPTDNKINLEISSVEEALEELRRGKIIIVIDDPAIARTCSELSEIAYQQFSAAQTVIRKIGSKKTLAARIMMAVYKRIYDKLLDRGWDRLDEPVSLTKLEKGLLILRESLA